MSVRESNQTRVFRDGMSDGVRMVIDLILGENHARKLPDYEFQRHQYQGILPDELRTYLLDARERADEEAAERGRP